MIGHQWWWLIINNINWRLYWDPTRRTFTNIQITFRQNKIHANCHSSLINRYETPYLCWNPVPVCRPKIVGYRLALPNFLFLAASQSIPPPRFRRNWSRYLCVLAHWHPTEFSVLQLNVHIYIQNVFCCMLIIIRTHIHVDPWWQFCRKILRVLHRSSSPAAHDRIQCPVA